LTQIQHKWGRRGRGGGGGGKENNSAITKSRKGGGGYQTREGVNIHKFRKYSLYRRGLARSEKKSKGRRKETHTHTGRKLGNKKEEDRGEIKRGRIKKWIRRKGGRKGR
jgi:hypothetical protein